MDFKNYSTIYKNFIISGNEVDALKSLLGLAKDRLNQAMHAISDSFMYQEYRSVVHSIDEKRIYESLHKSQARDIVRVPGVTKPAKHPLYCTLMYIKEQNPKLFSEKGEIAIEVSVQKDFDRINELKYDVNESLKLFDPSISDININVNIDIEQPGNLFVGGILIKFMSDDEAIDKTDEMSEIIISRKDSFITNNEEVFINGISSNDMVEFVREVIKEYVKRHPGITLSELQRDLAPIHNGDMFKCVEDKNKIERLSEKRRVYHSLSYTGKLDDGTEYVVYSMLYPYRELRKTIEFARKHSLI